MIYNITNIFCIKKIHYIAFAWQTNTSSRWRDSQFVSAYFFVHTFISLPKVLFHFLKTFNFCLPCVNWLTMNSGFSTINSLTPQSIPYNQFIFLPSPTWVLIFCFFLWVFFFLDSFFMTNLDSQHPNFSNSIFLLY